MKNGVWNGVLLATAGTAFVSLKFYLLFSALFHVGDVRLLNYQGVVLAGFSFSDWFAIGGIIALGGGFLVIVNAFKQYDKRAWGLDY